MYLWKPKEHRKRAKKSKRQFVVMNAAANQKRWGPNPLYLATQRSLAAFRWVPFEELWEFMLCWLTVGHRAHGREGNWGNKHTQVLIDLWLLREGEWGWGGLIENRAKRFSFELKEIWIRAKLSGSGGKEKERLEIEDGETPWIKEWILQGSWKTGGHVP